ncbi:unnamed protein product, partial [marine sediment metagenome]
MSLKLMKALYISVLIPFCATVFAQNGDLYMLNKGVPFDVNKIIGKVSRNLSEGNQKADEIIAREGEFLLDSNIVYTP